MINKLLVEARIKIKTDKPKSDNFVSHIVAGFRRAGIKANSKNVVVSNSKVHGLRLEVITLQRKISVVHVIGLRTEMYKLGGRALVLGQKTINGRPVLVFTFTVKKRGIKNERS